MATLAFMDDSDAVAAVLGVTKEARSACTGQGVATVTGNPLVTALGHSGGKMMGMAKEKMTVTISPNTLSDVDSDAREDGVSRSEYVARVLVDEHYRRLLARVTEPDWTADDDQLTRAAMRWQNESAS